MSLDTDLDAYETVRKNYNEYIIKQNYRFLDVCKKLDKDVYYKICYDKNGDIDLKYLLEAGSGFYENPTKADLDAIKKEFGDAKHCIESKSKEEISQIVESFNSLHQPV